MPLKPSDVMFSPTVKSEQEKRGSRASFARRDQQSGWPDRITPDLATAIGTVRSFYLGTVSAGGQPYIQHRGGPPGFLTPIDEKTLAFADYSGNRQYITIGNLADNPRAFIFLMDYARRLRIKLWGSARVVEGDDALTARVGAVAAAAPERVILFEVTAWDRNCNQHIPRLLPAEAVEAYVRALEAEIAELKAANARLADR